jgi:hypothetical protein
MSSGRPLCTVLMSARTGSPWPLRSRNSVFSSLGRGLVAVCPTIGCLCVAFAQDAHPLPNNYKELVYNQVKSSFVDPSTVGAIEISPAHPSRPPQDGDWMVCLRIELNGQPTLYAAFINSEPSKVILLRRAVRFDGCPQDQFEPLVSAPPADQKHPPASKKK